MNIQIISKNVKTFFCDFEKEVIKVCEITYVKSDSTVVEKYKKEFYRGCDSFCKIETLRELKEVLKAQELKEVLKAQKETIAVFELKNGELVCFSFTCSKEVALQEVQEITEQKVLYCNEVEEWKVPFYLEDTTIIKLNVR